MFKKIQEMLEAGKISQEVAQELDNEVSGALKEVRDEAAEWRVKYQNLNKTYEEVTSSKSALEGQVTELEAKIEKAKEEGKAELVKELESEKQSKQELMQKLQALEAKSKDLTIENELTKALEDYNVIDKEVIKTVLKSNVDLGEDGLKFKAGDSVTSLEDGLKKFFDDKPHLLKAKDFNGSGVQGGQAPTGVKKSQMDALQKAEFIKKHGQEAYLNLQD